MGNALNATQCNGPIEEWELSTESHESFGERLAAPVDLCSLEEIDRTGCTIQVSCSYHWLKNLISLELGRCNPRKEIKISFIKMVWSNIIFPYQQRFRIIYKTICNEDKNCSVGLSFMLISGKDLRAVFESLSGARILRRVRRRDDVVRDVIPAWIYEWKRVFLAFLRIARARERVHWANVVVVVVVVVVQVCTYVQQTSYMSMWINPYTWYSSASTRDGNSLHREAAFLEGLAARRTLYSRKSDRSSVTRDRFFRRSRVRGTLMRVFVSCEVSF